MDAAATRRFVKAPVIQRETQIKDIKIMDGLTFFNSIKKISVYFLLFLLPLFFIPTPWAPGEFGRSLLILAFVILFFALDIIKVFSGSRVQIAKSRVDLAIGALVFGATLATLFSTDLVTSLWGFDKNLGSGFILLIAIVYFGYSIRDLLRTSEEVAKLIRSFVWGVSLSAFLSLMALLGTDVLGKLMGFDLLVANEVSILGTPFTALIAWGGGLILLLTLIAMGYDRRYFFINLLSVNFLVIAFIIFSIGQSFNIILLTLLALLAIGISVVMRREVASRNVSHWLIAIVIILIVGVGLVRVPSIENTLTDRFPVAQQMELKGETTWGISMASLAGGTKSGFLGIGLDTFPIIYNAYRPAYMDEFDLSATTFSSGSNEFMTIIGTRGLLGGLLWLTVGGFILYYAYDSYRKYLVADTDLAHLLLTIFATWIYLLSFVTSFNVLILFMFVLAVTLSISLEATNSPREARFLVMQFDMLTEQISRNKKQGVNWAVVVVISFIAIFAYWGVGRLFMTSVYAISAENKLAQAQKDVFEGKVYTREEERQIVSDSITLYNKAISIDEGNTYLYRRAAILIMQHVEANINEASQSEDPQAAFDALSKTIETNTEWALELTEEAKERAPLYYSNWDTRASVLTRMVGYGYTSYLDDAKEALSIGYRLNPNNPGLLYSWALLLQSEGDYAGALSRVNEGLAIRVDLEPVLLGAQLNIELDKTKEGAAYLQAALTALEEAELQESELYIAIQDRLTQVNEAIDSGDTDSLKNSDSINVPAATEEVVDDLDLEIDNVETVAPTKETFE